MRRIGLALVVIVLLIAGGFLLTATVSQLTGAEDINSIVTALSALISGISAFLAAAAAWRGASHQKPKPQQNVRLIALPRYVADNLPVRRKLTFGYRRMMEEEVASRLSTIFGEMDEFYGRVGREIDPKSDIPAPYWEKLRTGVFKGQQGTTLNDLVELLVAVRVIRGTRPLFRDEDIRVQGGQLETSITELLHRLHQIIPRAIE
ncbi:hypothetical protein [Nonomuraea wenchangensis]|uniref:Uncharacterized protein n=1 Tax=Nonomuraea wenchangensis TaxID=568860 RepID=A0A1I0LTP4_9ACTN|nr:hypothetical protein [Nonomuraea wenchangensis]SEU46549.1 hypothetical protein SAMN05421811_12774 [Nonomuraea wenchangensis]